MQSAALRTENDDQALPSVAFYHIPSPPEVYKLFTEVAKGTVGAFQGVGVGRGQVLPAGGVSNFHGDVNEAPCVFQREPRPV
jgi:hypothetical protein